jgi:hypothetical protein
MCQSNDEIQYKPSALTREKEFSYITTKVEVREHNFSIKMAIDTEDQDE